jgi:hypothetical protein
LSKETSASEWGFSTPAKYYPKPIMRAQEFDRNPNLLPFKSLGSQVYLAPKNIVQPRFLNQNSSLKDFRYGINEFGLFCPIPGQSIQQDNDRYQSLQLTPNRIIDTSESKLDEKVVDEDSV